MRYSAELCDRYIDSLIQEIHLFCDKYQKILGRKKIDTDAMMSALSAVPFETVSMDFIFALPGQTYDDLRSDIDKAFKAKCYTDHKHGFYVYAKPNKCDPKSVIKYIGRYLGRPVIAIYREEHSIYRSFNQWRTAILSSFGYDSLEFPACGTILSRRYYYEINYRGTAQKIYQ